MITRLFLIAALCGFNAELAVAGSPVGAARVTGAVLLNGAEFNHPGVSSFPVADGDRIVTGDDGYAAIATGSDRFEIRNRSRATLRSETIDLESGVVGSESRPVQLDDWAVESRHGQGWFVVSRRRGQRLIAAHRGAVVVHRPGRQPFVLPAGAYALYPGPADDKAAKTEDEEDDDGGAGAAERDRDKPSTGAKPASTSSQGGGFTIGSLSTAQSVAVVAGAGAAATAAGVGLALNEEDARSPSN